MADLQPEHVPALIAALKDEVMKVRGAALEAAYLKHWASELGLTNLLDRALRDAGVAL